MNTIRSLTGRVCAYLKAHKAARIAAICALVIVLLLAVVRPYGTKTYLIMGLDNYGKIEETGRSDVIMLVQVNFTKKKIDAVTFARDMIILDHKGADVKINTIVRRSDENALMTALENDFGVKIDGWFRVNFTTVIQLVEAIGGAEVELTEAEARYINHTVGIYPESPLAEGKCRLNGAQALCYARCRALDSDLMRGKRQSRLLGAMVQSTKRMNAGNLVAVYKSLNHAWTSSLSGGEQLGLLFKALWLRGAKVDAIGLPFEGTFRYGDSKSGVGGILPDMEVNRQRLLEELDLATPVPGA